MGIRNFILVLCATSALIALHESAWAQANGNAEADEGNSSTVETVTVTSTRSGKRLEDEAIHVEMIDADELAEGSEFNPGQIGEPLGEMSGIRLQVTAPSLGGANLSIQGLKGHYTQILADGLPLYGAQNESLGVLQIPPADLGGIEVIKGVASALYGPSALGGVVNLISRHPEPEFQQQYVANATTLDGQDLTAYLSGPISEQWGYTLLGSVNREGESDLNHDGWADVPSYNRAVVRPRLFWDDAKGDTLLLTAGATYEGRNGGTLAGSVAPDGNPFPVVLDTQWQGKISGPPVVHSRPTSITHGNSVPLTTPTRHRGFSRKTSMMRSSG
jgi:iron complex outermembrane receptor protein